ncbi:MAG: rhodanese [Deltaproteobacteria bacterium RIFCSPLOWO2_02_FULL_53_8]|nr:MAG: rhodanese [Deltaproteobacteria bacterium RIFCSPLOWO2_02_FULL_53_8]
MTVDRLLRLIAGVFIVASLVLSKAHSEYWLYFTCFVGLNLIQSFFTKWCLMMTILRKLGVKNSAEETGCCC